MELPARLQAYRERCEQGLRQALGACDGPEPLAEAMAYSLLAGGKRLRPVLLLAAYDLFAGPDRDPGFDPLPAACALEFIHTYSLIHDDLPAMDDDDLRRGRPTSHKRFGEAMAILAGDALLTEAFALMARAYGRAPEPARALAAVAELALAAGAGGMVGGQVLDVEDTGRRVGRAELEQIHRMKTGALLTAAARCGALLGGADEAGLEALTRYGRAIGLAFQVADDVLDVVGARASLGKSVGKDQAQGKNSYAALLGVAGARALVEQLCAEAARALEPFGPRAAGLAALGDFIRLSLPAQGGSMSDATRRIAGIRAPGAGPCDIARPPSRRDR